MYKVLLQGEEIGSPCFLTKEDAELYLSFSYNPGFTIEEVPVFQRMYFHSLNPYIATFDDEGKMVRIAREADDSMLVTKFNIEEIEFSFDGKTFVYISFWDAGDLERAKVLAQSFYEGWKYAKESVK